jgi:mannose-6-phosphate isomerase-like protein (cupin superfamily)
VSIFKANERPPAWCELESFEIYDLALSESVEQQVRSPKERLLIAAGTVQLLLGEGSLLLKENQFYDLPTGSAWMLKGASAAAQVVCLSGHWGRELGGCGVFRVENVEHPVHIGDAVSYPKTTTVDPHYHDCDEYWIMLEGSGTVVVGTKTIKAGAGECVPIGMGHHHDMATVDLPVKAVFFETTLEGLKRTGHLWNHTHGPAQPQPERAWR